MCGPKATGSLTVATTPGIGATGHALPTTERHGVLHAGFTKVPTGVTTKGAGVRVSFMAHRRESFMVRLQAMPTDTTRTTMTMAKVTGTTNMISLPE